MPLATRAAQMVADRMPKMLDAKTHAVMDYVVGGTCLAMAAFLWKRNKRASIAATMCGAATLTNAMLTDYPGGVKKIFSFETHGRIDAGLAGLTATMPTFFAFRGEEEAKYFTGLALAETVVTGLTDFESGGKVIPMPVNRNASSF
ncbi:MAG TPA: hypothetical protein VMZ25_07170 [Terriglobales bacterium]|nr:hypothetical protein [Terriglobales bacterium]